MNFIIFVSGTTQISPQSVKCALKIPVLTPHVIFEGVRECFVTVTIVTESAFRRPDERFYTYYSPIPQPASLHNQNFPSGYKPTSLYTLTLTTQNSLAKIIKF